MKSIYLFFLSLLLLSSTAGAQYVVTETTKPKYTTIYGVGLVLTKFDVQLPGDTSETFIGNYLPLRCDFTQVDGIWREIYTDLQTGEPVSVTDILIFKHRPKMRIPKK